MPTLILTDDLREEIKDALLEEIKGDTPMAEGSIGYLSDLQKAPRNAELGEDHPLRDVIEYFQIEV
jgi:hypothetical protein